MTSFDPTRWFEHAFDADYLKLYAHRDDRDARRAVDLFATLLPRRFRGLVLDLACGMGRHSAHLQRRGFHPVGVDLSDELLLRAMIDINQYAAVRADMRALPFATGVFGAVANFFTSFGYFASDEENERVAAEMARVLRPGGWLLWDHINPAHLRSTFNRATRRRLADGARVTETRDLDEATRRVRKHIHLVRTDGNERIYHESVRFYEAEEAAALFETAGFELVTRLGDYDEQSAFSSASRRQILLCRKRAKN